MNYHIDLSPPNISKTLPKLSLYTTGKPEYEQFKDFNEINEISDVKITPHEQNKIYRESLDMWLATRYAYLQEQEWKPYEKVHYFLKEGEPEVVKVIRAYPEKITCLLRGTPESIPREMLSHYYIGQTVPSSAISYVREKFKFKSKPPNYGDLIGEWQPSPEPEEAIIEYSRITGGEVRQELSTNPLHTEWMKDLKSGKAQAVINQT